MYKASFVLFMNIQSKRYAFYNLIHDYFETGKEIIDHQTLLEFGQVAGLSKRQTEDEVIGCLYAPFLIKFSYDGTQYQITENARLKFTDLITEGKYQLSELGLSIQFEEKYDRLRMHLTDSLSNTFIEQLLQRGWSRNKSLYRLMKRSKEFASTLKEVEFLMDSLPIYSENDATFNDLIKLYGRYWLQMKTYTSNLLFRGHYKSSMIPIYPRLFEELFEVCKQPIDWKGKPITVDDFSKLLIKHSIKTEVNTFIEHCIRDSLLRYCSPCELTLTSSGYSLIRTYFKYSQETNYLMIFFRRITGDSYLLMLGENSLYPNTVQSYLSKELAYNMRGWFTTVGSKDQILQHMVNLKDLIRGGECNATSKSSKS